MEKETLSGEVDEGVILEVEDETCTNVIPTQRVLYI